MCFQVGLYGRAGDFDGAAREPGQQLPLPEEGDLPHRTAQQGGHFRLGQKFQGLGAQWGRFAFLNIASTRSIRRAMTSDGAAADIRNNWRLSGQGRRMMV